jgi:hypothetical protein
MENNLSLEEQFNQIVEGWKNLIVKNPEVEEIAKERLKTCLDCFHLKKTTQTCRFCHCFMPAAVRVKDKRCPMGKWSS